MNELEAIAQRKSRRSYLETPIEYGKLNVIQKFIDIYNQEANLSIRLIKDGSKAFNSFKKSYGLFKGVKTLIALAGKKDDIHLKEKIGYYGELLILEATKMKLGTCWVGGTFDSRNSIFATAGDEKLVIVITIGNVTEETLKDKIIHNFIARKKKELNEFYTTDSPAPKWFIKGLESVQKAPSAVNRQPVKFEYKASELKAFVEGSYQFDLIDLGIAKAHFSIATGGHFELGNYGKFIPNHSEGGVEGTS